MVGSLKPSDRLTDEQMDRLRSIMDNAAVNLSNFQTTTTALTMSVNDVMDNIKNFSTEYNTPADQLRAQDLLDEGATFFLDGDDVTSEVIAFTADPVRDEWTLGLRAKSFSVPGKLMKTFKANDLDMRDDLFRSSLVRPERLIDVGQFGGIPISQVETTDGGETFTMEIAPHNTVPIPEWAHGTVMIVDADGNVLYDYDC